MTDQEVDRLVHVDGVDGNAEDVNTRRHRAPISASG
jgi:hypothetical protein